MGPSSASCLVFDPDPDALCRVSPPNLDTVSIPSSPLRDTAVPIRSCRRCSAGGRIAKAALALNTAITRIVNTNTPRCVYLSHVW